MIWKGITIVVRNEGEEAVVDVEEVGALGEAEDPRLAEVVRVLERAVIYFKIIKWIIFKNQQTTKVHKFWDKIEFLET